MVNVYGSPTHTAPAAGRVSGVTVMVATTGALPLFRAVKDPILPVPEAAKPMLGVLLVQLNTVPGIGPEKLTAVVVALLQTTWLDTESTLGISTTGSTTSAEGLQLRSIGN